MALIQCSISITRYLDNTMKRLIILGAGGFGRTVADLARQLDTYSDICHLDDRPGDNVIGPINSFAEHIDDNTEFLVALGNNSLRMSLIERILERNGHIATLIHPMSYVSPKATIAAGSIVLPMAVVNTEVSVGRGCIVNCGAIIDHGCVIEDGCHISPGAIVKAENRIAAQSKIESGQVVANRTFPV